MAYIDIHCHVLPGIDDGAVDLAETVSMLRRAWEGGTRIVVATPHLYSPFFDGITPVTILDTYHQTLLALRERSSLAGCEFLSEMELLVGAENHLTPELLDAAAAGDALTLGGTRYLLVEPAPFVSGALLESAVDRLLNACYWPVLAHIERYEDFHRNLDALSRLLKRGCLAQINAGSVLGADGRRARRASFDLLSHGLVDVVASDGHGADRRKPDLGRAANLLASEFHPTAVQSWFEERPAEILGRPSPARPGKGVGGEQIAGTEERPR